MATLEDVNSSATLETDITSTTLCSPCDTDGKRLEAIGYCVNCKEYLCDTCFKYHRLPSLMRKHVLLDQDQIKESIHTCPNHEKQVVEYHCPTHAFLGCHACFFLHQKTCRNSKYIPDVAQTLPSSEEFIEFSAKLDHIASKTKELIIKAKQNLVAANKRHTEGVAALKAFKLEVIEAIERLEKDILSRTDSLKQSEHTKLEEIISKCVSIQEANSAISTEIGVFQNRHQNVDLYISMVTSKDKLLSLEDQLTKFEGQSAVDMLYFKENTELKEILKRPWGLGLFYNLNAISITDHVTDINVKTEEDENGCCIRGSALMPGSKLVIGDYNNKKVKLIDTRQNKVVSVITFSKSPWSVTKVTDTTVAVTVPADKKIVFVKTDPSLNVDRELGVREECHGIAYCDGKLVVTLRSKNKVQVLDLQGTVLREFQTDNNGNALFSSPYAVAVYPKYGVMYVSNSCFGSNNVLCLQLEGNVIAAYRKNELIFPKLAVADRTGVVFAIIRHFNHHSIHIISPDCKEIKVLKSSCGLAQPETINYDESKRRLYVGGSQNNMRMYRVS